MTPFVPGVALKPLCEGAIVTETCLVLHMNKSQDLVIVIPTTPRRKAGRTYFVTFRRVKLSEVLSQLTPARPMIATSQFEPRPITKLTGADLEKRYPRREKKRTENQEKPRSAAETLEHRWMLIAPLVTSPDHDELFDHTLLRAAVERRARALAEGEFPNNASEAESLFRKLTKKIRCLLDQYWAGGSTKSALSRFTDACGGKGRSRVPTGRKLGRPNAPTKSGRVGEEGFIIDPNGNDAAIIAHCYEHSVLRGNPVAKAYRDMCTQHYSKEVSDAQGRTKSEFLDANLRPTLAQFRYWGTYKDVNQSAFIKQLPPGTFNKDYRALTGSATDDVYALGQRGCTDSTSIDLELVSIVSRLDRIGSAHRILLVDVLTGYIPGFYLGLEAPSAATVKLAIYHALLPDKRAWLEGLGLDHNPADWIPISFSDLWADNTDLRCDEVFDALSELSVNVHYVPVARSDLNSSVEVRHHTLHRQVDHNLPGTTHGRRTVRGEETATYLARYTLSEAIRETTRAVHVHNTIEIPIPQWARKALRARGDTGPTTRLALAHQLIREGKLARAPIPLDFARNILLPRHAGTFTRIGVKLHRQNTGDKICFLEPVRYVSRHRGIIQKCEEAQRGGKHNPDYFRAEFLVDPYDMRSIWYLDVVSCELIELNLKDDNEHLLDYRILDVERQMVADATYSVELTDARDRALGAMEADQDKTSEVAEQGYSSELTALDKKPSKASLRANKSLNRQQEKTKTIFGIPPNVPIQTPVAVPPTDDRTNEAQDNGTSPMTDQAALIPTDQPSRDEAPGRILREAVAKKETSWRSQ